MKVSVFALLALILPVSGCVTPPPAVPEVTGQCGASELQGLVGQPQTVLQTMRFGQRLRVIEHGMAVTMDYDPARLNIQLDQAGIISKVSCG